MFSDYESAISRAEELLLRAKHAQDEQEQLALTVDLARAILEASTGSSETHERQRAERLAALMDDRPGQEFATALTDRVHRSTSGGRLVGQVTSLTNTLGVPRSLSHWDRLELRALLSFGANMPELTARAVRRRIHEDASPYMVPAAPAALDEFLKERRRQNVRVNVNHLGEEVLGKEDEQRYLETYLSLLRRTEVDTISVKLSSIDSQLDVLAFDRTLARLATKLERIYQTALENCVERDGHHEPKLVYLDMEAYRELELTFELYLRVLDQPAFARLGAGIVLQAYLPDSFSFQKRLVDWARRRVKAGGAPVRMRLVKGANLALERIEASLTGLELAPYSSKHEVDANFKRMLHYGLEDDRAKYVHLGVGSHNLFDISLMLVLRARTGQEAVVEPEMLEGMADPLRRVVQRIAGRVLVYAPSVDDRDFSSAVAYLVRRLDENTGDENFLRHSFSMRADNQQFEEEKQRFLRAERARGGISSAPNRSQDRRQSPDGSPRSQFENEPHTDFARSVNRAWLAEHLEQHQAHQGELVSRVAGHTLEGKTRSGFDPSRPGVEPYRYQVLDARGVERALGLAESGQHAWQAVAAEERENLLLQVAGALRTARGELIAKMVLDAGKRVHEADLEVAEAIDFAEYYARQHRRLRERFELEPKGLTVITPPWNFPLAIGLGSALAALVTGNTVLLKPPPETGLVLGRAVELCLEAGIDEKALGLVYVDDEHASGLVTDERVKLVMLTGGTTTARLFQHLRPTLDLVAETGGKNAIIVSAMSDREQAVSHIVSSAFGHAGQKCSACSLLILEREVFQSATFKRQLKDATESLAVGSAWELDSYVTPLIRPPEGALKRALSQPRGSDTWLTEPRLDAANPRLMSPGVRWGVAPDSFLHQTELFGPVLSVLEAENVARALELANATAYGLTAGIQTLDKQEERQFLSKMRAGNLYVNRPITGSVVGRQPFGGQKASAVGHGLKAGGPNALLALCTVTKERVPSASSAPLSAGPRVPASSRLSAGSQGSSPQTAEPPSTPAIGVETSGPLHALIQDGRNGLSETSRARFDATLHSYRRAAEREFLREHRQDSVLGHRDELCYARVPVLVVADETTSYEHLLITLFGLEAIQAESKLLVHQALPYGAELSALGAEPYSTLQELGDELVIGRYQRLRYLGTRASHELLALASLVSRLDLGPPASIGHVELLKYLAEQTHSVAWHRHGNLGTFNQSRGG